MKLHGVIYQKIEILIENLTYEAENLGGYMKRNARCRTAIISKTYLVVQNHIYCNARCRPQKG
jgi:hypothetical protein